MKTEDLAILRHLAERPAQRLVHQHASEPSASGHIVYPESAFFRWCKIGAPSVAVRKTTFRRLKAGAFLKRTNASSSADEYTVSDFGRRLVVANDG